MKKLILIVTVIIVAPLALFFLFPKKALNNSVSANDKIINQKTNNDPVKSAVLLPVPFTTQAPFVAWLPPYNETCEEANLVMAMRWVKNQGLTPQEASSEMLSLVVFENKNFGFNADTTVEQTSQLIRGYYHYDNYEIKRNASLDDIKSELNSGNIVIIPAAGKLLNNPHFTFPGPDYHMLLIRGYDNNKRVFITNDPGTKYGERYEYNYLTIDNAWHDWTGSVSTVSQGGRKMIILKLAK